LENGGNPSSNYSSIKRSSCGLQRQIKLLLSSRIFLSKSPVLTTPPKKEQLLLYLAATTHVVSTAIVVERQEDGHAYPVQRPVYFVSEVLSESKARYQPVQKLLYALLITSRKLQNYFQEYSIYVVTDYPLGDILWNQDATRRISKWAVELGALNIDFKP
jgi:hypothetical protein